MAVKEQLDDVSKSLKGILDQMKGAGEQYKKIEASSKTYAKNVTEAQKALDKVLKTLKDISAEQDKITKSSGGMKSMVTVAGGGLGTVTGTNPSSFSTPARGSDGAALDANGPYMPNTRLQTTTIAGLPATMFGGGLTGLAGAVGKGAPGMAVPSFSGLSGLGGFAGGTAAAMMYGTGSTSTTTSASFSTAPQPSVMGGILKAAGALGKMAVGTAVTGAGYLYNAMPGAEDALNYRGTMQPTAVFGTPFEGQSGAGQQMRRNFGNFMSSTNSANMSGAALTMGGYFGSRFAQTQKEAGTAFMMTGMDNAAATQGLMTLQSAPMANRLMGMGVFVNNLSTGDYNGIASVVDQIWDRMTGGRTDITYEDVMTSLRGGQLGATLRAEFGHDPALYQQVETMVLAKAKAKGASLSKMSQARLQKIMGIKKENSPYLFTGQESNARAGAVDANADALIRGVDRASGRIVADNQRFQRWGDNDAVQTFNTLKGDAQYYTASTEGAAMSNALAQEMMVVAGGLQAFAEGLATVLAALGIGSAASWAKNKLTGGKPGTANSSSPKSADAAERTTKRTGSGAAASENSPARTTTASPARRTSPGTGSRKTLYPGRGSTAMPTPKPAATNWMSPKNLGVSAAKGAASLGIWAAIGAAEGWARETLGNIGLDLFNWLTPGTEGDISLSPAAPIDHGQWVEFPQYPNANHALGMMKGVNALRHPAYGAENKRMLTRYLQGMDVTADQMMKSYNIPAANGEQKTYPEVQGNNKFVFEGYDPANPVSAPAVKPASSKGKTSPRKRLASGGDSGTSTSDSIPAMLSKGEYVINARAVAAVGKESLDRINALGHDLGNGYASPAPVASSPVQRLAGGTKALSRTHDEAIDWALTARNGKARWFNKCDRFVANAYGQARSGYESAYKHWLATPDKFRHPGDKNPPIGALVYWDQTATNESGHAAIVTGVDSKGNPLVTTTHTQGGKPVQMPLSKVMPSSYLGWAQPYFQGKRVILRQDIGTDTTPNTTSSTAPRPSVPVLFSQYAANASSSAALSTAVKGFSATPLISSMAAGPGVGPDVGTILGSGGDRSTPFSTSLAYQMADYGYSADQTRAASAAGQRYAQQAGPSNVGSGKGPNWLAKFLYSQGLRGEKLKRMWGIAMRESGGRPWVDNEGLNRDGSIDYGLFQINNKAHADKLKARGWTVDDLRDPLKNFEIMMEISNNGKSLGAWGIHNPNGSISGWAASLSASKVAEFEAALDSKLKGWNKAAHKAGIPGYQQGLDRVNGDQNVRVHDGEMILPLTAAEELRKAIREMSHRGPSGPINITLKIEKASDAEAIRFAEKVKSLIEDDQRMQKVRAR